jgi:Cellulase (glycosyl hydrolase family 5)
MKTLTWYFFSVVLALASAAPAAAQQSRVMGPTPLNYFGVVIHRLDSGTPWPPFQFGSWRFWDAYVGWPYVEPKQGDWQFKRLDLYVSAARAKGVDIIYPLGMSAPWASARPTEKSGYKPGYAAEPADLENWRRYVHRVAERYEGKIKYYEIWNEPSDKTYFSGDPDTMVKMLKIAYETIKQADPTAQVIAPGVTGVGKHLAYLDDLLGRGAKNYIDILGHHYFVPNGNPEEMVPLIREVLKIMRKHGMENKPMWNTETGWWIGNGDGTPDHQMVAKGGWKKFDVGDDSNSLIVRAFLIARSEGVERFFWYSWDNLYGFGMREPTTGQPKPMAAYYNYAVDLMNGWTVKPCEKADAIWICKLEREGEKPKWVVWTTKEAAIWPIPASFSATKLKTLDGTKDEWLQNRVIKLQRMPQVLY